MDKNDHIFLEKLTRGHEQEPDDIENLFRHVLNTPKAELHCHLGGSMRPETLRELACAVSPSDWSYCDEAFGFSIAERITGGTIDAVKEFLEYRKKDGSLADYMLAYSLPKTALTSLESISRVAFEVCEDNYREGVRYLELRFNPWMLTGHVTPRDYIKAMADGLHRAMARCPGFEAVLLMSLIKDYEPDLAARILDEALEANRDPGVAGLIKGIDSAGNEIGFAPGNQAVVFAKARDAGLSVISHAGEAYESVEEGIAMIERVIDNLGARRIGHGLAAGVDALLLHGTEDTRGKPYNTARIDAITTQQSALRKRLRNENILIEVCPSSNIHTGNVSSLDQHPLKTFLADRVPVAICTDNRRVSHTKLTWEIVRMAAILNLNYTTIDHLLKIPFSHKLTAINK